MSGVRPAWAGAVVVLLLLVACSPEPLAVPRPRTTATATLPDDAPGDPEPTGTVTVAYPDEPAQFLSPAVGDAPAADDLAGLWGLPLFRLDGAGQLRRGLVSDWEVRGATDRGWQVDLRLRSGTWTDGTTVDASDVVASLQARVETDGARFGVVSDVTATDDDRVSVVFDRPYAAWSDLLLEAGPMLPREVVDAGIAPYADDIPVSGGWFRLAEYEPGLRLVLEAHPDGPLGPPRLARIEVLFTPSFETALGLLEDGEVDVLLGYVPLNGVARATEVTGVEAAAPLGGTLVALQFRPGGVLGGPEAAPLRRGVAETVRVDEMVEGLLGSAGDVATSPWPSVPRPPGGPVGEVRESQQFALLYPSGGEVLGFAARAIQRDLTSRGMTVDIVGVPAPRFQQALGDERDVALVVRRTGRRPSLAPFLPDAAMAHEGGAVALDGAAAERALAAVAEHAQIAPLFRVGALHAWRDVDGMRPSSWLGAGFWNAGEWAVADDS